MNILLVNKFFYPKGGGEYSLFRSSDVLQKKGHEVMYFSMQHPRNVKTEYEKYFISNVDYEKSGFINEMKCSLRLLYSFEARKNIDTLLRHKRPDIAHLHNIYHQISPSILHSLKKYKVPIVMTLHDYKIVCAAYVLLSGGKICEACKNGKYYNCLLNKCVKDSRLKSILNTFEMFLHHKILHVYNLVDVFISPSIFLKDKIREMGFHGKIMHLPNFVNLEEYKPQYHWQEKSIVCFGRVSREKGLFTLIEAMKGLNIHLKIIGEGPIKESLEARVRSWGLDNIRFTGYKSGEELKDEIRKSMFVILPSEWYENNPISIIEGFALGKPAIGARIGGIPELIKENETGLTFESGNAEDLKAKILQLSNDSAEIERMGRNARRKAEEEFNTDIYYEKLINIYKVALNN